MIKAIDALVLFCEDLEASVAFYRALGVPLEDEVHESGPKHFAAEVGGAHFALYEASEEGRAPGRRAGGATQVGFQVEALDDALKWLLEAGAEVLVEPQDVPWGRRAVVLDPDGRAVELNQAAAPSQDAAEPSS